MTSRKKTQMSEKPSAIDSIAQGLDGDPEGQPDEEHDITETPLFMGEDFVEVKISHVVTVAGKDHYIGTTTNFRAFPGENQYELGERAADFALEANFAIAAQFRDMKTAEIVERKRAGEQHQQ